MLTVCNTPAKLRATKISRQASSTHTSRRGDFLIPANNHIQTVFGTKGTVHGSSTGTGSPRRWCEMLGGNHVPSPLRFLLALVGYCLIGDNGYSAKQGKFT